MSHTLNPINLSVDAVIIGGGIAGLLTFRHLKNMGKSVLLFEKTALGSGQTLASQGIIHGGSKYALQGKLSEAAETVAQMTSIWGEYLAGGLNSGVDLSGVKILSPHHYLWASGFGASLKTLISSKVLSSDNRVLKPAEYPEIFQYSGALGSFSGSLCELDEVVLDVQSLLEKLIGEDQDYLIQMDDHWEFRYSTTEVTEVSEGKRIEEITYQNQEIKFSLTARSYLFMAGEGNEPFLKQMGQSLQPAMQKRPLKMVMVKHPALRPIYAHYVGMGTVPELTVTSHPLSDDSNAEKQQWIWYLGGAIAEEGVSRPDAEQYLAAVKLMKQRFPWLLDKINFEEAEYALLEINRAEVFNHGKRPDSYGIVERGNALFAWPTKLTLAPALVHEVMKKISFCLESSDREKNQDSLSQNLGHYLNQLPKAFIAKAPWENTQWEKIPYVAT